MLRLFRKQRGAVSIFLIIVLVPILMVSSIFVDMSRIKLAGAMAESAGDLTLNTALTNYDAVLKDMYGLFATSQDMDELFLNLEDYYRESIESAGVPKDNVDSYVEQVMSFLKTSTGTDDLMNITVTDFNASVPTDAHLGNPAIMKSQIVEFMKYRAPINLGMGMFEAIAGMTKLDAQTKLVENKTQFYTEHQKLLEELEEAWRDIVAYQYDNATLPSFPTGTYISDQAIELDLYTKTFKENRLPDIVKYLNNYDQYIASGDFSSYHTEPSGGTWKFNGLDVNVSSPLITTPEDVIWVVETVQSQISDLKTQQSTAISHRAKVINAGSTEDQVYYIAEFNEKCMSDYSYTVKSTVTQLLTLQKYMNACPKEDLQKTQYNGTTLEQYCNTQINSHLNLNLAVDGNSGLFATYNAIMKDMGDAYKATTEQVEKSKEEANGTIVGCMSKAVALDDVMYENITHLSNAIGHLQTVYTSLTSDSSAYKEKLDEWSKAANGLSDDTMGQNDLEEIEDVKEMVTPDRVNSLIIKLTAAKTSLEAVRSEIAKYKFMDKKWTDFIGSANFKEIVNMIKAQHEIKPGTFDSAISSAQSKSFTGKIKGIWTTEEAETNPDLCKNQRELHIWLFNNYGDKPYYSTSTETTEKTKSKDSDVTDIKNNLKAQSSTDDPKGTASTKVSTKISDHKDSLPSVKWNNSDDTGSTGALKAGAVETDQDTMLNSTTSDEGGMSTLLKGITDAVEDMAVSLRDRLYITDYVMNMFSYNTYEAEIMGGTGSKYKDSSGTDASAAFSGWYTKNDDGTYTIKDAYKKYEAEAINMTNNPINPNVNYLYGSEVEYIIYGGDSTSAVTAAYGTIFMIRFAFNTVYAFTDAEVNNIAMSAATAVFGTPPLTPLIPIAKVAIILGFAIAESAYDLFQLKTGAAVPLMKTKDTWTMSASNAVKAIAGEVVEVVANKAIDKGYELIEDALEKTDEELSAMLANDGGALDQFTDSLVDSSFEKLYDYANEAVQQAVQICHDVNLDVAFLEETVTQADKVALVSQQLNDWIGSAESGNDAIYEVKKIAVNYLIENNGEQITKIFDAIDKTKGVDFSNTDALNAEGTLTKVLEKIRTTVEGKVDEVTAIANTTLENYKTELVNSIKSSAAEGVESFRETVSTKIADTFGDSPKATSAKNTVVSSIMAWTYSDYLTLFLLVSTMANEQGVLLRTADIIQLNVQHINKHYGTTVVQQEVTKSRLWGLFKYKTTEDVTVVDPDAYSLTKAYTHVQIDATLEVEPLFMDLPFMKDTTDSVLGGKNWYQIQYSGTLGY